MKKILAFILAMMMVFSLVACGGTETTTVTETMTVPTTETMTVTTEYVEDTLPPETTSGPVPSPEAPLLDFDVTGFDLVEDYEGNPALIVFFIWTNGTDETTMFEVPYLISAYQDGIGLDSATISCDHEYAELTDNLWREIRPGATLEMAKAFSLRSDSTIIEIEFSDWLFGDKPLMLLEIDTTAKG